MRKIMLAAMAAALLLAACSTRSISNSGYGEGGGPSNSFYAGELKESDVIGVPPETPVTEADIANALKAGPAAQVRPHRSQPLLVVQSGALVPDDQMLQTLRRGFTVASFNGVPPADTNDYSRRLRHQADLPGAHCRRDHSR